MSEKETEWVDEEAAFHEMLEHLWSASSIAVDTEGNGFFGYRPRICLLQFATRKRVFLVDVLAFEESALVALKELFEDNTILKVMHAADNDLIGLQRDFSAQTRRLFDTFLAARFLDLPQRGLAPLLKEHFDIHQSKKFQRLDWSRRPLPEEALYYAAMDVYYLLELSDELQAQLHRKGYLDAVFEESQTMLERPFVEKPFDTEGFWKVSGVKSLTPVSLGVLRSLFVWRHEVCMREDRAAFLILPDADMLQIARRIPRTEAQLKRLLSTRSDAHRFFCKEILAAVSVGIEAGAPARPARKKRRDSSRGAVNSELYDSLREWRASRSKREGLEPGLIAPNQLLEDLSRQPIEDIIQLAQYVGPQSWRLSRYGEELLGVLASFSGGWADDSAA